ncbi:iron-sulfur cluster assembly accessory protein [Paenibacillus rhizovicinus]|uniref:Iron-sulfur cluster assembly accessory protein n=1 Tax=Paenibacillus rhizovicinus TaxID=2704463 RepID=A0A6C0PBU6_9BACL|nr:iron-sulfur cluster assembly accessory protein [Paenibacillus rhizovicinus]QHW34112.1 iron-sulfur cluster assembly accessory protein [Paenibacillus rhizovicinus]
MNIKITRNAAKMLREETDKPENDGKFLRVFVTHSHGDHAHYGMKMDDAGSNDEVIETDKDIKVVLEKGVELLDGVRIDYFYVPQEGFMISNPTKGNHGDH